ncbi:MAG: hypothetical protein LQ350_003000 [Teloschistes chrysophthalmus]|nr:MAG: hypothetical protein LQ350_003000 [Niorma chrysophthalma]
MARKQVSTSKIPKDPVHSKHTASMPTRSNQKTRTRPSLAHGKKRAAESPIAPDLTHQDLRPPKRQKSDIERSTTPGIETSINSSSIPPLNSDHDDNPSIVSSLSSEVQKLGGQYHFSNINVISSSKIQQKVKLLLARLEKPKLPSAISKAEVVILEAKAAVLSKMISIVEIAKAEIATRNGEWYQYSSLRAEILPYKTKPKKEPSRGLQASANKPSGQGVSRESSTGFHPPAPKTTSNETHVEGDDSEDEEAAFETFQHQSASNDVKADKVRTTPIMTIYFSSVPISGLKDLLG